MPQPIPITNTAGEVVTEMVWDVTELATLVGLSDRTIRRRINSEMWPHIRGNGGRVYFTAAHVRHIVTAVNETHDYPAHEPGREYR